MPAKPDPERNHSEASRLDRIAARFSSTGRLFAACTSLLYRTGQLIVLLAVFAAGIFLVSHFGWRSTDRAAAPGSHDRSLDAPRVAVPPDPIPWEKVDANVATAATAARNHAESVAARHLETWNAQLLARIDADFLPWYFSYWNQQTLGLKALWQSAKYHMAGYITAEDTPSPSQQMIADIQQEFANRVLRPESAQLFLEQLTRQTVDLYLADLRERLDNIQASYKIPQPRWDRYLEDIAISTQRVEANRQVPLTLKALAVSSIGAGALLARSLARIAGRFEVRAGSMAAEEVGGKILASAGTEAVEATAGNLAGRADARLATDLGERFAVRAGGKVIAKTTGRLLGPIAAAGIIAWDVYDHRRTVDRNMPILRESLVEYLALLKESLLHDPQTGLASPIHALEAGIVQSVTHRQPQLAAADQRDIHEQEPPLTLPDTGIPATR